jgi:hypothetical protein
LTVDAATKAALTSTGAKLTIEIDTAGTRVFLADQRTGQLVGGPEDLARLGGIRSFVTRERKDAQGVEIAREVTQLAYKSAIAAGLDAPGMKNLSLESNYGAAVRPLLSVINIVGDNMKKLDANTNDKHREVLEKLLKTFFVKIRNAYFNMIILHTKGEDTKGKLHELLFESGVPEYVHAKLTNRGLVLDRGQELARVLYPSDPSKGIALTLKEWRSEAFRNKLGQVVLLNSGVVMKLVNDSNFLRTICKIDPAISLEDETNPSVAKLLKCRVAVMPPMSESEYVTDPASKTKAGWKFPSPSMDSIQGAMNSLSTALLRMYSANLQSVDLVGDYYATIVPSSVTKAAVTPTNNFYVQWSKAPEPTLEWLDRIRGGSTGTARADVWRWLRTEMRLSEKAEGGKSLALCLLLNEDGSPAENEKRVVGVDEPDPKDNTKTIRVSKTEEFYPEFPTLVTRVRSSSVPEPTGNSNLLRELDPTEIPHWKRFQADVFPSKKKKGTKGAAQGSTLTRLTKEGISLCEELETLSPHLADRMRAWLRGFSDERVQRAAVKLANASFDELFIEEAQDSDDGSDSDESDNED